MHDRINSAYSRCGSKGTLETVRKLTGVPINYLITVNFRGFRQIVDKLGGVWLDVDRRYYNKNDGRASTNFSNIDLQPGYQRLNGADALAFVRFRHTDADYHRLARQQAFVRAFKEQVAQNFDAPQAAGDRLDDHEERRGRRRRRTSTTGRCSSTRSSPRRCPAGTSSR